jgi:hypothetical protein
LAWVSAEGWRTSIAAPQRRKRRAGAQTDAQVLEDAERLIAAWNERQGKRMPMLFSPTIGAAVKAGYWFLWVHCPACRTINAIDLRALDRHPDAALTSLIPALSYVSTCFRAHFFDWVGPQSNGQPVKCGEFAKYSAWRNLLATDGAI